LAKAGWAVAVRAAAVRVVAARLTGATVVVAREVGMRGARST